MESNKNVKRFPWKLILPLIAAFLLLGCIGVSIVAVSFFKKNTGSNSGISDLLSAQNVTPTSTPTVTPSSTQTLTGTPTINPTIQSAENWRKQTNNDCNISVSLPSDSWKLDAKTETYLILKYTTVNILYSSNSADSALYIVCTANQGFLSADDLLNAAKSQTESQNSDMRLKILPDETRWGRTVKAAYAESGSQGTKTKFYAFTTDSTIYVVAENQAITDQNIQQLGRKVVDSLEFK
jgi:hypothetical protein